MFFIEFIIHFLQFFILQFKYQYCFHLQLIIHLGHFKFLEELIQNIIYLRMYGTFWFQILINLKMMIHFHLPPLKFYFHFDTFIFFLLNLFVSLVFYDDTLNFYELMLFISKMYVHQFNPLINFLPLCFFLNQFTIFIIFFWLYF